MNQNWFC